jgi:hypothetical protein
MEYDDLEREIRSEFYQDYYSELRQAQKRIQKKKDSENNKDFVDIPF